MCVLVMYSVQCLCWRYIYPFHSQIDHHSFAMLLNCLFLFKDRLGNWIIAGPAIFLGIYVLVFL